MHTFFHYYIVHHKQYFSDCYKQLQKTHTSTFSALSNRCSHALTTVHCKYVCTQEAHIAEIYRSRNQLAFPSTFIVLCCTVASVVLLRVSLYCFTSLMFLSFMCRKKQKLKELYSSLHGEHHLLFFYLFFSLFCNRAHRVPFIFHKHYSVLLPAKGSCIHIFFNIALHTVQ